MQKDDDGRRIGLALLTARRRLQSLTGEKPSGSEVVFQVIKEIMDIEKRMKVRAPSPKHLRAQLIEYVHDPKDREDAAKQRRIDEAAGDDPAVVWEITLITTPEEIKLHDAVKTIFRASMVGKNQIRDWKMLQRMARRHSHYRIAKDYHISRQRVEEVRDLQCAAIWNGVSELMPQAATTGRLWVVGEATSEPMAACHFRYNRQLLRSIPLKSKFHAVI